VGQGEPSADGLTAEGGELLGVDVGVEAEQLDHRPDRCQEPGQVGARGVVQLPLPSGAVRFVAEAGSSFQREGHTRHRDPEIVGDGAHHVPVQREGLHDRPSGEVEDGS